MTKDLPVGTGAVAFVALAALILALILAGFRAVVTRTFVHGLRAGGRHRPPRVYGPWTRRRTAYLAAAQHGDIALYSGDHRTDDDDDDPQHAAARSPFLTFSDDPAFLGAGSVAQVWSVGAEPDLKDGRRGPHGTPS
ncbi:hypothetical protein [Nonomuraea sp. NPDC050643]|uniref:hypothetical protein n=1 Tax=Nonomuraea sp. NPDC050643 TaxID=3155660 RepID=UPI0033ED88BC